MPATDGQYYLEDYIAELKARGFDGFSDADLKTYVNRGYFHIARKYPHYWKESTSSALSMDPGTASVALSTVPLTGGSSVHHVDHVFVTSPEGHRKKLLPMDEEIFFHFYQSQDLTASGERGAPSHYFIHNNLLLILPPPDISIQFVVHYHRRPGPLVQNQDLPITPIHLDEAILLAAIVRCHKRANEPGLAALAEADLAEFFDDMLDDDEMLMAEDQDRVRPDDTWL